MVIFSEKSFWSKHLYPPFDVNSWSHNLTCHRFPSLIKDVLATEQGPKDVGARSDLLRYEAVYQFGGIYMDTDSKSVKGFGPAFSHSFVTYSLAPWNLLQNSVFGMAKGSNPLHWFFVIISILGSKFMSFVLESARINSKQKDYKKKPLHLRYGPTFLTSMFVSMYSYKQNKNKQHSWNKKDL